MSRSGNGWIIFIVLLGVLIGIVGGAVMGGVVALYVARNNPAIIAPPIPQEIRAVSSGQQLSPVITNMTVNAETQLTETVKKVEPAVVTVVTNLAGGGFGGQASGSGVIISGEGHIITNNHVIDGASTIYIVYSDGTRRDAQLIGSDQLTDIAVLKVNGNVPAVAPFGDSNVLQLGEWVIAIGSPLGNYRGSVTVGVVSGINRRVGSAEGLVQTDAAINHGNSGGPLINMAGQIVGINTLIVRDSIGGAPAEGLGFAVPSNTVRSVAEQLISRGRIEYPFIGISYTEVTPQLATEMNISVKNGVIVTQVTPGSPAARSGIQAQDVVTKIDSNVIDEDHSLRSILFQYRVGDEVTLTVVRGGREVQIKLTLVGRPA